MSNFVSIARVTHIPTGTELAAFHAAHEALFGDTVGAITILGDPNDANQAAVVGEVHDLDKMRAISRTREGDAVMRKYGFLEQLSYFVDEA